jgi:NAD(P)-dependent dehydrogenase (short-subunit alcohol dehydrogenase family)
MELEATRSAGVTRAGAGYREAQVESGGQVDMEGGVDQGQRVGETALIVGAGPGVSASCARLFACEGMQVAVAARRPDKPELEALERDHGVTRLACDAADPASVTHLFEAVEAQLGRPRLVVHNIDGRSRGIFRKAIVEADPALALATIQGSAFSAFLVGQAAARSMLAGDAPADGHRGTILFTNASAAFKGYPKSAAFAIAAHGKAGLAESLARELMPQGIHVVHCPIDAAIGVRRDDGSRGHWLAGESVDDDMADPDRIAETYLHLHRQHRSTWTFEAVMRPWTERW